MRNVGVMFVAEEMRKERKKKKGLAIASWPVGLGSSPWFTTALLAQYSEVQMIRSRDEVFKVRLCACSRGVVQCGVHGLHDVSRVDDRELRERQKVGSNNV